MGNLLLTSIYENDQPVIVTYIMLAAAIIICGARGFSCHQTFPVSSGLEVFSRN